MTPMVCSPRWGPAMGSYLTVALVKAICDPSGDHAGLTAKGDPSFVIVPEARSRASRCSTWDPSVCIKTRVPRSKLVPLALDEAAGLEEGAPPPRLLALEPEGAGR